MVMLENQHGAPMEAHMWVCSGENIGRRFALDKAEHLIGRTANIDIPVLDERVSQMHAKVVLQDGRHFVEDLGSTNGTYVNNQPLTGPRKLQDGDLIQVGETVFEYISAEKRNLTVTVRGTNKEDDAVPETLRAGAQEALNRARQGGPISNPHSTPPHGTPRGYHGPVPTTVDVASEPIPGSPPQGIYAPHYNPYMADMGGMYDERRAVLLQEEEEEEGGGIDIQEIIRKVKKVILFFLPYWKVTALLALLFAVLGAASIKLRPPARTAVFMANLVPAVNQNPLGQYRGNVAFFKSAQQNFRSHQQVTKTLEELGIEDISPGLVAGIQGRLSFESIGPPQPNTYRGSFIDADGGFAVAFLNTHVKIFLDSEIEKTLRVMSGEAKFLQQQLDETSNELRETEAALLEFKKANIESLPTVAQAKYQLLFSLQQERSRVELALERAVAQQQMSERQMETEKPLIEAETVTSDPYRGVIAIKNQQLVEATAAGKGPQHPDVVRLQRELEALKRLSKEARSQAETTKTAYNPTYRRILDQLRGYQLSERVARKELAKIDRRIKKVRAQVERLPELEARHAELTRSYGAAQQKYKRIYEQLSNTKIQLELERASAAARYDIIAETSLVFVNTKKQMVMRGIMGFAGGVFLGLLLAAFLQLRNHPVVTTALTLRDPDADVPAKLD